MYVNPFYLLHPPTFIVFILQVVSLDCGLIAQPILLPLPPASTSGGQHGLWVGIRRSAWTVGWYLLPPFSLHLLPLSSPASPFSTLMHCVYTSGGQLGLWVGISVITLCELLALITQLLTYFCAANTKQTGRQ